MTKENKKRISGFLMFLLVSCYLFATSAVAQKTEWKTEMTGIQYQRAHISYGDVWEFDQAAYDQTKFGQSDAAALDWYVSTAKDSDGEPAKASASGANYASNYFVNIDTENGVVNAANTTLLQKVDFSKFNANVNSTGTVASPVRADLQIPVVTVSEGAEGVYSVVPNSAGKYYIYAYKADSAESPVVSYALLDSGEATNAFAYNAISEWESIGNGWYRGEVTVDTSTGLPIRLKTPRRKMQTRHTRGIWLNIPVRRI